MDLFNIQNIPMLGIEKRMGCTDYIDFLKWDEVTSPIIKGVDIYGRFFIVIKLIVDGNKIMETYFQRFTDNYNHWMACGHATRSFLSTSGTGLIKEQVELLKKVMNCETVLIEEKHNTEYGNFIGDYVRLYNEKKEKAATIIQKKWRICRYNPKYTMCQKIQYDGLKKICNS